MRIPLDTYSWVSSRHGDPVAGSRFGKHLGVDLACAVGTVVYAPVAGVIRSVTTTAQVGKQIELAGDDGRYHRFLHLSSQDVLAGQRVKEGQRIGLSGNTGSSSTGAHLHWDIRKPSGWADSYSNYANPATLVDLPVSLVNKPSQGGDSVTLTEEAVKVLYRKLFNREGDPGGIKNYTGKTLEFALSDMLGSQEFKNLHVKTVEKVVEKVVTVPGGVDPAIQAKAAKYDQLKAALN